jgi:KaiC/GvpD/RAD55 family RecA-like ATPase
MIGLHSYMLRGILLADVWEANRTALQTPRIITNADVATLVMYIGELHKERPGTDKTPDDLVYLIQSKWPQEGGRREELETLAKELGELETPEFDDVQPRISAFLANELALQAAMKIGTDQTRGELDLGAVYDLLTMAQELATGVDLDIEDMAQAPPPDQASERRGVATVGLGPSMDRHLRGGVGRGELLFFLAPPGVGKTSLLKSCGVQMAMEGEHVLDITLEISGAKVRQRVDQKLTGMSRDERIERPLDVVKAREKITGAYYIKDWCSRNVTVDDIRTLVRGMRARGKEVSVVSVDYLELMAPSRASRDAKRFEFSDIAKEMRRLANELDVILITAWQINREGSTAHVLEKRHVSECWDIIKHADIILGLNQNEEELANNYLRVNIMKQRESTVRAIVGYYSDLNRMLIRETEGDLDEPLQDLGGGSGSRLRQHGPGAASV